MFVFYTIQLLNWKESKFKISYFLSIFAFLVFIFGLQEFFFKKNILYDHLISNPFYRFLGKRMMSFHYHPSVLATYFLSVLPFSIFLAKFKRNQKDLIVGLLGVCSCLLGTLVTFTRTAFLILFICFSFYFFIIKKKYLIYIFLFSIVLISVATVFMNKNTSFARFSPFNPYHIGSIRYRLARIPIAIEVWMLQPLTGVGFGNFRYLFNVFGNKKTPYEFKIPDNMYLSLLSETGILGSVSFLLFLFILLHFTFKKMNSLSGEDKGFLRCNVLGFCMLLLNMLSYDMFYWHMPLFFFWFYVGLIASICMNK
jgi:O-antigen ligase